MEGFVASKIEKEVSEREREREERVLGWAAWIFTGKVNNQPRRVTLYSVFPSPLSPLRPKSKVSRQLDTASNFGDPLLSLPPLAPKRKAA